MLCRSLSILCPLVLALGFFLSASQTETGALTGTVKAEDGMELPGVTISLVGKKLFGRRSTITDENGRYLFKNLPAGPYRVTFAMPGLKTVKVSTRIEAGKTTRLDATLEPSLTQEIIVVSSNEPLVDVSSAPNSAYSGGERYARIKDNGFVSVKDDPLSTFSIDVDTAAYANVRRFLTQGVLPPPDAVRLEEMVNYFTYDDPEPEYERPFAVTTQVGNAPWNPDHRLLRVGLKARSIDPAGRPACNLVFLIDVSGSMQSAHKLPLLKDALGLLAANLDERDKVSVVVYASDQGVALPPTSGADQQAILDALEQLRAGGGTNGEKGIQAAYRLAAEQFITDGVNRVILATDGDFNLGVHSHDALVKLAEDKAKTGIELTVLGFGMGNLNDKTLERLAVGNGNYAYIDTLAEAEKVLVEEVGGTLVIVARDVKMQLEFNPAEVAEWRLLGYENRLLKHTEFNDDSVDAGDMGAGHSITALYELVPPGISKKAAKVGPLKYQRRALNRKSNGGELLTVKLYYKPPKTRFSRRMEIPVRDTGRVLADCSDDLRFSAAVAAFALKLRDAPGGKAVTWRQIEDLAEGATDFDPNGYRNQFLELVGKAAALSSASEKLH
ncbi:MAG: von Willebrand factor type A domain-containing protein [Acidobacteriota bacterium]|nr:von Willebrand factor type A domain-containing protein [Acidobacteriota bacterium]